MGRRMGNRTIIALALMLLGFGAGAVPALAINDLVLNVAPGSDFVQPGDTVTVTLDALNLSGGINGVQVMLAYDPLLMTLVNIAPTNLGLFPPNAGWVEVHQSDTAGDILYAVSINGGQIVANHTVATLTFTVIAEGVTSVTFRPDQPPLFTKFTFASDNTSAVPNKFDSTFITSACDDGLFCNGLEFFSGAACVAGSNPCNDFVACTDDSCDDVLDVCTNATNDANCDDTLFCNGAETCDAINDCQPGIDPCNDAVACTDDSCDDVLDVCTNAPNDLNCDDTLFCNGSETCDAINDCQPGTSPCDDLVGCTNDSCDDLLDVCTNTPIDANCADDGLFCNGMEVCDAVNDCVSNGDPCLAGTFCNETTNICDQCSIDADCTDLVPCTDDTCVGGSCVFTPNNLNCDDGLFCNGAEVCDAVNDCQAGTDPCVDAVACTVDTCDDVLDTCTNAPNDSLCDDTLFCTGVETCDAINGCLPGTTPCDDAVACTDDVCDDLLDSCTNTANDANCDDLLFCTGIETCDAINGCLAGTNPCSDGVVCTDDLCDEVADTCASIVNDANCDDGAFCNGMETCDAISDCQPGTDPCQDNVGCTVDSCDEILNVCTNAPNDALCDDLLFCTGVEVCDVINDCQLGTDPCAPLFCDETGSVCLAPLQITNVEIFYSGRFLDAAHAQVAVLTVGSVATLANITNYTNGITGIRVTFNQLVNFATTPDAAFGLEWTTGTGTIFSPVTAVAGDITASAIDGGGFSIVDIVLADDFARKRWLKVTVDSTQITTTGVNLDGELSGNPALLPSGDGTPGGNAIFIVGNMPGDVGTDRRTTLGDVGQIRIQVNPFVITAITNAFDVNKDGRVLLSDVGASRLEVNPFITLPLIAP